MVHLKKPKNFKARFEIVSLHLEGDGKLLLLKRQKNKPQAGMWGVPAGKVNKEETKENALEREILEETGIDVAMLNPNLAHTVYVEHDSYEYSFVYHIYHAKLRECPSIILCDMEHSAYGWFMPRETLGLNLIPDEDTCIKLLFGII